MGAGSAGCLATQAPVHSRLCPSLPVCPWGPTMPLHSFAHSPITLKAACLLVALETASKELRCSQSLRIPRDPGLLSLQVCGGRSSPDSFFAGGSWKVWLLELQATPPGAEAALTLALPWEGVHGRPPSFQHPLAHLHLTFSPRTEHQPAPLATRRPSPNTPSKVTFIWGKGCLFP